MNLLYFFLLIFLQVLLNATRIRCTILDRLVWPCIYCDNKNNQWLENVESYGVQ